MVIEKNRWIRNGIALAIESIKVLFRNPILLVYTLVPLLTSLLMLLFIVPSYYVLMHQQTPFSFDQVEPWMIIATIIFIIISLLMNAFFMCGLAHHTMHILRQHPITVKESFHWVRRHVQQILGWILLPFLVIIISAIILFPAAISLPTIVSAVIAIGIVISAGCVFFCTPVGTTIIATEKIPVLHALKRAMYLVWSHLGTYLVMLFGLSLIVSLLMLPIKLLFDLPGSGPFVFLSMIANTIFYYEFYVKNEEVVVYHEQKDF